jgi:molybdopterin synthase catalytic subunit
MKIVITDRAFDPWAEVQARQRETLARPGAFGATAVFVGSMRDFNEGDAVKAMTLTHYQGMTERHLGRIAEEAAARWPIDDVLVIHRVGAMMPGDPIVAVAVWSAHRAAAFDACRYIMEDLKSRAPFWKKEVLPEGERWVEHNTPG